MHVALAAPDAATAAAWRARATVIAPPLWQGEVQLHVIEYAGDRGDPAFLMALVDLGLIDAADAGFIGYPSGIDA